MVDPLTQSTYFPTENAVLTLDKAIGNIPRVPNVEFVEDQVYELEFKAGTYFVAGDELNRVQELLRNIDAADGKLDHEYSKFAENENPDNFQWRQGKVVLTYEAFVPRYFQVYAQTQERIAQLSADHKIYPTSNHRLPPLSFLGPDDVHTFTRMALENNLTSEVLEVFVEHARRFNFRIVVPSEGMGVGISTLINPVRPQESILQLSLEAALPSVSEADFTDDAKRGIEGWSLHEVSHIATLVWARKVLGVEAFTLRQGENPFLVAIKKITRTDALFRAIIRGIYRAGREKFNSLAHYFGYFASEVCDYALAKMFSLHQAHIRYCDSEKFIGDSLSKNKLHYNPASHYDVLVAAWSYESARSAGIDQQRLIALKEKLNTHFKQGGDDMYELFNNVCQFYRHCTETIERPDVMKEIASFMFER